MADERTLPHKLQLSDRKFLSMTGVTEVIRFDEEQVLLRTCLGILAVQGKDLQLKMLSPQGGEVSVEGQITALFYQQGVSGGGKLRRWFG